MTTETILGKLVAKENDTCGYITYVFEIIEQSEIQRLNTKYVMCVRFPNWEHRELNLDEIGYLSYNVIVAGVDKWFDGSKFNSYRYTMIQFVKFIHKPKPITHTYRL